MRRHGLAGREDLLRAACVRDAARGEFWADSRVPWLVRLAEEADTLALVRRAVLDAVRDPPARTEDREQLEEFLVTFARRGDAAARRALARWRRQFPAAPRPRRSRDDERPARPPATVATLDALVTARRADRFALRRWGLEADAAARAVLWRRLRTAEEPSRVRRLLTAALGIESDDDVARSPRARLVAWTAHADRRVRFLAYRLLARTAWRGARAHALERLRTDARAAVRDGALRLLARSARDEDAAVVALALAAVRGREERHRWLWDARAVAERHTTPAWTPLLVRAFELRPCAVCRERALRLLVERGAATDELLREATLDAESGVRDIARAARRALRAV